MPFLKNIFLFFSLLCVFSCGNNETTQVAENLKEKSKEELMQEKLLTVNKQLLENQNTQIDNYIQRRNWEMQETSEGLRIEEYKKGNGKHPVAGNKVNVSYTAELINGTKVYDSKTDGILSFEIGKGEVPVGLETAVQMLSKGSKARVILPSHLAYGFSGDGNRIPKQAILIYDIEIL